MTKWPVQKLAQGTTQKLLQHHDANRKHGKRLTDNMLIPNMKIEMFKENMLLTKLIEHQNNMSHTINERHHKIHTEQVITLP